MSGHIAKPYMVAVRQFWAPKAPKLFFRQNGSTKHRTISANSFSDDFHTPSPWWLACRSGPWRPGPVIPHGLGLIPHPKTCAAFGKSSSHRIAPTHHKVVLVFCLDRLMET